MKFGYSSERMLFSFFLGVSLVGLFYIDIITQDLEERSVYTGTENGGLYQGSFSADDGSVYLVYIEPEISCEPQFSFVSINDVILFPDCDQTLDEDGWQHYTSFVTSEGEVNVTSSKEIIIVDDSEYQTWALMLDYMVAILLFFGSIFAILMPPLYSFISVFSKLSYDKKGDRHSSTSEFNEFESGENTVESEIMARSPKPKHPPKRRNDAHQSENDTSDPGGDQRVVGK